MSQETTKDRIKRAAQLLFAHNGIEGVSVRDIARASDCRNSGSLNYHFRSKEDLIRSLVEDALAAANGRWDQALAAFERQGGPRSVREVVEVLVFNVLSPQEAEEEPTSARFLAMLMHTRRQQLAEMMGQLRYSAYDRAIGHIRRLLPEMPAAIQRQRIIFFFGSFTVVLAMYEAAVAGGIGARSVWGATDPLANFVDAAVGMLEAPVTEPPVPIDRLTLAAAEDAHR